MSSATITTIIKMIESLPDDKQERIMEHLREYIADLERMRTDGTFYSRIHNQNYQQLQKV